jgi:aspartate 1-decarboxylase
MRTYMRSRFEAVVTDKDLNYEGSITLNHNVMEEQDIAPGEQVHVVDVNNGARFITYAIMDMDDRRNEVCVNGAAARLVEVGDKIIVMTYETR